jgi:hypothetical protein
MLFPPQALKSKIAHILMGRIATRKTLHRKPYREASALPSATISLLRASSRRHGDVRALTSGGQRHRRVVAAHAGRGLTPNAVGPHQHATATLSVGHRCLLSVRLRLDAHSLGRSGGVLAPSRHTSP